MSPNALEMHEVFVLYDDSLQTEKHRLAVLRAAYEKDVEHQLQAVQWDRGTRTEPSENQAVEDVARPRVGFLACHWYPDHVYRQYSEAPSQSTR